MPDDGSGKNRPTAPKAGSTGSGNSGGSTTPQSGGRFASTSDNIKNKANTARLQGDKTFTVLDNQGNTVEYITPQQARHHTVNLSESIGIGDQAKARVNHSVVLNERLAVSSNASQRVDRQRAEIQKQQALQKSKENTQFIQSKIQTKEKNIASLNKNIASLRKSEQSWEKRPSKRGSEIRGGNPFTKQINSLTQSIRSESSTLSSLQTSLGKSQQQQKNIKKTATGLSINKSGQTSQRSQLIVNPITYYGQESKLNRAGPAEFGPYVTKEGAKEINQNRQIMQDDKDRSRQITVSSVAQTLGLNDNEFVRETAKRIDKSLELDKLPKERSEKNIPIFGQSFVSIPSNKQIATQLSPLTNYVGEIADFGRGVKRHIESGGKQGFEKHVISGLPQAESYYYKSPLDSKEAVAAHIGVIAAAASAGASFGAPIGTSPKSLAHPFRNFKSESVNVKPTGGNPKNVLQIEPTFQNPSLKINTKSLINKKSNNYNLPQQKDLIKLEKIPDPIQLFPIGKTDPNLRRFQVAEGRTKGGTEFKVMKDLKSGDELGFMTKKPTLKAKKPTGGTIPLMTGIDQPTEFTKGKSFNFGKFQITETRNDGIVQTKVKDLVSGREVTKTKVPLGESTPFKFDVVPRDPNKKGGMKPFLFLDVKKPKSEFDLSGGKGNKNELGLIQKQKQIEKQTQLKLPELKLESLIKQQQHLKNKPMFSNTKVSLGVGKGSVKSQKFPQSFFAYNPINQKTNPLQGVIVKPANDQKRTPKQDNIPFVGFVPGQTPKQTPDIVPEQPVPFVPFRTGGQEPFQPPPPPGRGGGFVFPAYIPRISLGSYGFGQSGIVKKGYAAYGISSDIGVKTLPTYSRYGQSSKVFAAQAKEDKKIQDLFYGKKKIQSKGKTRSKPKSKKTNTRKKKKK